MSKSPAAHHPRGATTNAWHFVTGTEVFRIHSSFPNLIYLMTPSTRGPKAARSNLELNLWLRIPNRNTCVAEQALKEFTANGY